jgi:hypothetical protein
MKAESTYWVRSYRGEKGGGVSCQCLITGTISTMWFQSTCLSSTSSVSFFFFSFFSIDHILRLCRSSALITCTTTSLSHCWIVSFSHYNFSSAFLLVVVYFFYFFLGGGVSSNRMSAAISRTLHVRAKFDCFADFLLTQFSGPVCFHLNCRDGMRMDVFFPGSIFFSFLFDGRDECQ